MDIFADPGLQVGYNLTLTPCGIGRCNFIASHIRRLVLHISVKHCNEPPLHEPCYVSGCKYRFRSGSTLRTHLKRYHVDLWNSPMTECLDERCEVIETEDRDEILFVDDINPEETSSELFQKFLKWVSSESLVFRLGLEHEYELPASRVKNMHEEFQKFLLVYQDKFETAILKRLKEMEVVDEQLLNMLPNRVIGNAIHTKTQAKNFFRRSGYVSPQLYKLIPVNGTAPVISDYVDGNLANVILPGNLLDPNVLNECEVVDGHAEPLDTDAVLTPVSDKMHYVPILETLKQYLSHDDVVDNILNEKEGPLLNKYNCGSLFHSHPVFKRHPKALRVILYLDEFEVCNPIGSSRGLHKLLAVYFCVGNLEQYHLSSLACIHLALLCEYRSAIKYTHSQVMQPLLKDLNTLSSVGIHVTTKTGRTHHWIGAIAFIAGDNKTQHDIAGFRGCFSSGRVCRFCMADYSQLGSLLSEQDCVLRTPEVHALHLQYVQEDPSQIPMYGVIGPSCFADLDVKCINEMFAPDVLHDVMEGLITMHLYQLMKSLHSRSVLKLRRIINLTSSFKYGRNDKRNKPRDISPKLFQKNYSLVGSASQRWTLFSVFPLAIGPHVPQGDKHWKLFLLSQKICDIIFAPQLDYDWLAMLAELVEEHHALWVELYPGTAVFKFHVLLHYARLLAVLGPVRHLWTMRFEAFHQYFIRMARKLKSFKCITKTLTELFQRRACLKMAQENVLPPKFKCIGKQSVVRLKEFPAMVVEVMKSKFNTFTDETEICVVNSVKWKGLHCYVGDFVIIHVSGDGVPVFLKITNIVLLSNDVILLGSAAYVIQWNDHFHAYLVHVSDDSADFICVDIEEVCSPQSLDCYTVMGSAFVKLKFRAPNKV